MTSLLLAAVALLSFANGANDNFKGVATLWGAGRTSYKRALGWATTFTFLGSLTAIWAAQGLVARFNGSELVAGEIHAQIPFVAAVALSAAATVLLASRLGLPISTTHALAGALAGASVLAAGFAQVKFSALGNGIVLPLAFSPVVSLALTVAAYPLVAKLAGGRDCVCIDQPAAIALAPAASSSTAIVGAPPAVRWARTSACQTGAEVVRWSISDGMHWFSAAAISFARGLNDTPKIAALLFVASFAGALGTKVSYALVALAMALGGAVAAARVAQTLSKKITPMATPEAVGANLVTALLVMLASGWALPVSTTHTASGSLFGIGLLRHKEADWRRVRDILLSWLATLPLGALFAAIFYRLLML